MIEDIKQTLVTLDQKIDEYITQYSKHTFRLTGVKRAQRLKQDLNEILPNDYASEENKKEFLIFLIHHLLDSSSKKLSLSLLQSIWNTHENNLAHLKARFRTVYSIEPIIYATLSSFYTQNTFTCSSYQAYKNGYFAAMMAMSEAKPIETSTQITNYYHVRPIASGGQGFIYQLTLKEGQNQHVVVKILRSTVPGRLQIALFRKEIETHKKLNHPNITQYLFAHLGTPMRLVIEHLPMGSLFHFLKNDKPYDLTFTEQGQVLCGTFSALVYLHDEIRIAHLDIKPENILLDIKNEQIVPKLCDFGFIHPIGEYLSSVRGSQFFMSPEIALSNLIKRYTTSGSADIFSMGMLMHILATKKDLWASFFPTLHDPCRTATDLQISSAVQKYTKSQWRPLIPNEIPQPMSKMIELAWQHNPDDRPTAQALLTSCQTFFSAEGSNETLLDQKPSASLLEGQTL